MNRIMIRNPKRRCDDCGVFVTNLRKHRARKRCKAVMERRMK